MRTGGGRPRRPLWAVMDCEAHLPPDNAATLAPFVLSNVYLESCFHLILSLRERLAK